MSRKTCGKIISLLLSAVLLSVLVSLPVWATENNAKNSAEENNAKIQAEIDAIQAQQKESKAKIDAYNSQIKKDKNNAAAAAKLQEEYQAYADMLENEVNLQMLKIDETALLINAKMVEAEQKQLEFESNEETLKEIFAAIYKMNSANPLGTMLAVDNFSDMLIVYDYTQRISQGYAEKLSEIMQQKQDLNDLREQLEQDRLQLIADKEAMEERLLEYAELINEQKAKQSEAMAQVAQTQEELKEAQKAYDNAQARVEALFKQFIDEGSDVEYTGGALVWPVPSHNSDVYITSPYGERYVNGYSSFHKGMDIGGANGKSIANQTIVAALDGKVILVDTSGSSYGNYMIIDHGNGIHTLYAHCASIGVGVGTTVTAGSAIGAVGNTGNVYGATGYHLHFELRINGTHTNPYPYLRGGASL